MLFNSVLVTTLLASSVSAAGTCGNYVVDSAGTEMSFSSYIWSDFRNLGGSAAPASNKQLKSGSNPPYVNGNSINTRDVASLQSLQGKGLARVWQIQDWARSGSPVPMQNVPGNIFIDYDSKSNSQSTMLSLTTSRGQDGIQQAAELDSSFQLRYGSIRFQARVTGDAGACAGLFLYADDTHESDFEFLTQEGPNYVHLTNQPGQKNGNPVPGATNNVTLKVPYNQWNTYRLDWMPGMTRYFINGGIVVNKTVNVSPSPMSWLMNIWSDGTSWPGVMAKGDSARLDIRWLQIAYNRPTDKFGAAIGGTACKLQNEMDGQGLIANFGKRSSTGGSLVARAASLISSSIIVSDAGGEMR